MQMLLALENTRFVIHLFGALVFSSMAWLYFDASHIRKHFNIYAKALGAFLIGFSFLVSFIFNSDLEFFFRVIGYLFLALGVWMEPLSERPTEKAQGIFPMGAISPFLFPLLPGFIGLGYFRRATIGLERHLTQLAYGMYFLMVAEILNLRKVFIDWNDPRVYELVREYGSIWILQIIFLGIGISIIGHWVFSYLLKRFETQLTLFFGMITILVFATSSITFTTIMSKGIETRALTQAQTSMNLLQYSEEQRSQEILSQAKLLAKEEKITQALSTGEGEAANITLQKLGEEAKLSEVNLLSIEGEVLLSWGGERGENLQENTAFKKAIRGEEAWGYETTLNGIKRTVATSIKMEDKIIGIILLSESIDSQKLTELSEKILWGVRIYGGTSVRAASSVPGYPELEKVVGLTEKSPQFTTKVLEQKETLSQKQNNLGGTSYLGVWYPVKDANNSGIGMWAVVMPEMMVWEEIKLALMMSYRVGILVLISMEIPSFFIARYLNRQVK